MIYFLGFVAAVYVAFLLARNEERRSRREFGARLGALYRLRSEFWRLRAWAGDAHLRGDDQAAAGLNGQAAETLPEINRQTLALRRDADYREYLAEIGWIPGAPDEELRDMAEAVTVTSLVGYDRWITGKGRTPVESVVNPRPPMEDDALAAKIHMAFGIVAGVVAGFFVYLRTYAGRPDATMGMLFVYMGATALVLGYVGSQAKDTLWYALGRRMRFRRWLP
ncbi:MAG: hypothetical protein KY467_11225 [Gemmatimonadetes bacterium]|nr:hypothetical protein [Gemmatimonadota bacterium]